MKFYHILFASGLLAATASCSNDEPINTVNGEDDPVNEQISRKEYQPIILSDVEQSISNAQSRFAVSLLKTISSVEGNDNFAFSPISISHLLSMLVNGADGNTRAEILKAVTGDENFDVETLNKANQKIISELQNVDNTTTMTIANSIWSDYNLNIKSSFTSVNKNYYDAECLEADFNNPDVSIAINNWVKEKTGGLIESIIAEGPLSPAPFVAINANYFNSTWAAKDFDPANTREENFTDFEGKTSTVEMMNDSKFLIGYRKCVDCEIGNIEYGNTAYSISIVLPREGLDLQEFIETTDPTMLITQVFAARAPQYTLELKLPKISLNCHLSLNEILDKTGIKELVSRTPNISGISDEFHYGNLVVGHKTVIKFEEKGTVAAAETHSLWASSNLNSVDVVTPPTKFHINRPFLFFITERSTNAIIYIGKVDKL